MCEVEREAPRPPQAAGERLNEPEADVRNCTAGTQGPESPADSGADQCSAVICTNMFTLGSEASIIGFLYACCALCVRRPQKRSVMPPSMFLNQCTIDQAALRCS